MRYNSRKKIASRKVNLLLVVNEEGNQHYCRIPKLNKPYRDTRKNHCIDHMCERWTQTFKTEETLNRHFGWCSLGREQIEEMPRSLEYKYASLGHELSPLRLAYAHTECYIRPDTEKHLRQRLSCMMSRMKCMLNGMSTSRGMVRIV